MVFVKEYREREEALGDELRVCVTNGLSFTEDVTEIWQYHLLKEMLLQQEFRKYCRGLFTFVKTSVPTFLCDARLP